MDSKLRNGPKLVILGLEEMATRSFLFTIQYWAPRNTDRCEL